MPSIYTKTLRDQRAGILGWGLGIGALAFLTILTFPAIEGKQEYDQLWEEIPESARQLFGGAQSITSLPGFLDSQLIAYLPLLLAIYPIMTSTFSIAGEQEAGTLDLILSLPVARARYLLEKMAAVATSIILIHLLVALLLVAGAAVIRVDESLIHVGASVLVSIPTTLVIAAIGFAGSAALPRRMHAVLVVVTALVAFFFVNALAPLTAATDGWQYPSPFYLFGQNKPLLGDWDVVALLIQVAYMAGAALLAVVFFDRKDLRS